MYQIVAMNIYFGMLSLVLVPFFGTRVPNRYYIVERCYYMCIFMLPAVHWLQAPSEHHAILGGFFFHSV